MSVVRVLFFNPETLAQRTIGGASYLTGVTASVRTIASQIGQGQVKIPITELAYLTDPSYLFIQQHDICVVYHQDFVYGGNKIGQFVIQDVKMEPGGAGRPGFFHLSGPGLMTELGRVTNHVNIGKENQANLHASYGMSIGATELRVPTGDIQDANDDYPSPFWPKYTIKKAQTLHENSAGLDLDKSRETAKAAEDQWAAGDAIWISRAADSTVYDKQFKTSVASTDTSGTYFSITLADESAWEIKSGDRDTPENYFPMFKPHIFKGDSVQVQMSDSNWHWSRVVKDPSFRGLQLESGPTVAVNAGATFIWRDIREANTTDDVEHIMEAAVAEGWAAMTGQASSTGSAWPVDGDKTLDILIKTAEQSGDYFYETQDSATAPQKEITWVQKGSEASTGLTISEPDQAGMQAAVSSPTTVIPHIVRRVSRDLPVTRVIPRGGKSDDITVQWDLSMCDEGPEAGLDRVYGLTATDSLVTEYAKGAWRVRNNTSPIISEETIDFGIVPNSESEEDLVVAANLLQAAAALVLEVRRDTERLYEITTVLPAGVEVNVGEKITFNYSDGEWDADYGKTLYISELEHFVVNTGNLAGLRQTRMILSEYGPSPRETGALLVAKALKNLQKQASSGGSSTPAAVIIPPSGGGATPPSEHDHADYAYLPGRDGDILHIDHVSAFDSAGLLLTDDGDNSGVFIADGGFVNIGGQSSPTYPLEVTNATYDTIARFISGDDNSNILVSDNDSNAYFGVQNSIAYIGQYNSSHDSNIRINSSGQVGLGISPSYKLDVSGNVRFDGNLRFEGPQQITTSSGNLTITPAGDLDIDSDLEFQGAQTIRTSSGQLTIAPSTGAIMQASNYAFEWDDTTNLQGESYSPPGATAFTQQWKIDTENGAAYFEYLEADQFHVRLFQADVTMATANGIVVTKSIGVLAEDTTEIPAVDSTGTGWLVVEDNPALQAAQVFEEDDWVRMRVFYRSSSETYLFDLWGQVSNYSDNGDGTQDWDFTTRYAGPSGQLVGKTVKAGAPILDYGSSGQPWWEVTSNALDGPYTRIGHWIGTNPYMNSNQVIDMVTGNLVSVTGQVEYGLYVASGGGRGEIVVSNTRAEMTDIPITMNAGGTAESGQCRIHAIEINTDKETGVSPNGDISSSGVSLSTGTALYALIDDDPTQSPLGSDYIYNTDETGGYAWFNLEDLSHDMTTMSIVTRGDNSGFTNDYCGVFAQVFKSDGVTALTDKVLVFMSTQTSSIALGITFPNIYSGTDVEWQLARLKLTWEYTVYPAVEAVTITPEEGITLTNFHSIWSAPPATGWDLDDFGLGSLTIKDTNDSPVTALYQYVSVGTNVTALESLCTGDSRLVLKANSNNASYDCSIKLDSDVGSGSRILAVINGNDTWQSNISSTRFYQPVSVEGGILIDYDGTVNATSNPMLLVAQGGYDGAAIELRNTDVSHDFAAYMGSTTSFGNFQKYDASYGGLIIRGASEGNMGLGFIGLQTTTTSTTSTTAQGPILLAGYATDGSSGAQAVGDQNNAIVMRSGPYARFIMKGDGEIHNDYNTAMTNDFDEYDDIGLVEAAASALSTGGYIQSEWDNFVRYNIDDLEELGIMTRDGFVSQQGITKLLIGQARQAWSRVSYLENRLAAIEKKLLTA